MSESRGGAALIATMTVVHISALLSSDGDDESDTSNNKT